MAMPLRVTAISVSSPLVFSTWISSSPSSSSSARMPVRRMFRRAAWDMRFTVPFFVKNTIYWSSLSPRPRIMAATFSSGSRGSTLAMLVPRAFRPASGMV